MRTLRTLLTAAGTALGTALAGGAVALLRASGSQDSGRPRRESGGASAVAP